MADKYNPQIPPNRDEDLLPYLNDEFVRVSIPLNDLRDGYWEVEHNIPTKLKPGVVKYFDGTDADPLGTGKEGLYRYGQDNAWHYVDNVDQVIPPFPTPSSWATLTLENGWTPAGPCVYRNGLDSVQVAFLIGGGTITDGTVLFTLPVGFRPAIVCTNIIWANAAYTSPPRVLMSTDGTVAIYNVPAGAVALAATLVIPR